MSWRALWALAVLALSEVGCNANTGGKLINMAFEIGGVERDSSGPLFFPGPGAWQVELDQGLIAVGPFYFNIQPPQTSTLQSGVVILEVTQQVAVDVLDPTLYPVDGGASGETGPALSAEVDLFPPCGNSAEYGGGLNEALCFSDPNLALLSQVDFGGSSSVYAAALVSGIATLPGGGDDGGSLVVPFQGPIAIDLSRANQGQPAADLERTAVGCNLEFPVAPATLQARVDPTQWFQGVNFASLLPAPLPCPDAGTLPDGGAADAGACQLRLPPGPYTWSSGSAFNEALYDEGIKNQGILESDGGYVGVYRFAVVNQ